MNIDDKYCLEIIPYEILINIFFSINFSFNSFELNRSNKHYFNKDIIITCKFFNYLWKELICSIDEYIKMVDNNSIFLKSILYTISIHQELSNSNFKRMTFNNLNIIFSKELPIWGNELLSEPHQCKLCKNYCHEIYLSHSLNINNNKSPMTIRLTTNDILNCNLPTTTMFACWFMDDDTNSSHTHITHTNELSIYGNIYVQKKSILKTIYFILSNQEDE